MQEKKEIKKKKLGSYPVASSEESLLVPAVIPDAQENVYFAKSDIAPTYTKGSNIEIENGIISKRDTKYESGDDVITVTNKPDNVQEISAEDAAGSEYVAGVSVNIDSVDAETKQISLTDLQNSDTSIWQRFQPTYRAANTTKYAGYSNKPIILADAFWSEATPDEYTAAARIRTLDNSNGYMTCYNHDWSTTKQVNFDRDLKTCNQIFIHQHKLSAIYFDYNFFKTHLFREVYITKSNTENDGCKVFFTARSGHKLKVIIYTAGTICDGETTDNANPDLSLMSICGNEWYNNTYANTFNYIRRPHASKIGFIGNEVYIPDTPTYGPEFNWLDENNVLCKTIYGDYVQFLEERNPPLYNDKDWRSSKNRQYYDDANCYYNAKKIKSNLHYKITAPNTAITTPTILHRPDDFWPNSYNEFFSSFKFIVLQCVDGGWEEGDITYDLIILADTRF
jgi:hypothetical protein